jgi:Glycosyltransferases, probably involved in cell wall biogenesis
MTVSFCVIAYNEENAISSLFTDIRNQEYPHKKMEIVLVNAMSTDKTRRLMEEFAEEENGFRQVIVLDNPKRIQAAGWNIAIQAATSDVIMRIDAHTMIPSNFVSQSIRCLENGEDVVGGPRPSIAEENTAWKRTLLLAETSMFGSSIAVYRKGKYKSYVKSVFHGAYRREVFEKAGLFNENLGRTEDNEMHYRIQKAGYKICYDPQIISYQHTRSSWRGMIQQKYGNGYWIGLTSRICLQCFSAYHFVPLLFVLSIVVATILCINGFPQLILLLLVLYTAINLAMSVVAVYKKKKYGQYFALPLIFLSLHLSYGIGTFIGLIKVLFAGKRLK